MTSLNKLPMGYWRQRAYARGYLWGLGREVTRVFDCEIAAGIQPELAYNFAVSAWGCEEVPISQRRTQIMIDKAVFNASRRKGPKYGDKV